MHSVNLEAARQVKVVLLVFFLGPSMTHDTQPTNLIFLLQGPWIISAKLLMDSSCWDQVDAPGSFVLTSESSLFKGAPQAPSS